MKTAGTGLEQNMKQRLDVLARFTEHGTMRRQTPESTLPLKRFPGCSVA